MSQPTEEKQAIPQEEALRSLLSSFSNNMEAARQWVSEVLSPDENGNVVPLTPEDAFMQVAQDLAKVEQNYDTSVSVGQIMEVVKVVRHFMLQASVLQRDAATVELWAKLLRLIWKSVYGFRMPSPVEKETLESAYTEQGLPIASSPYSSTTVLKRPKELEADVVKFQNKREKWIAFVGLKNGRPYEIFTGPADDEDGILLPKSVTHGKIIKNVDNQGNKRYDFQYENKRGYKTTVEGLSYKFNPEYWNYAKLISGVLRYGMPIDQVMKLVNGLQLDTESINTWKTGVERALRKYLTDWTYGSRICPVCGKKTLSETEEHIYTCTSCGFTQHE